MAKKIPTFQAPKSIGLTGQPFQPTPAAFHPQRTELDLREDAGFIVERIGDDGVGGPIEWIDEEFPRAWRRDI